MNRADSQQRRLAVVRLLASGVSAARAASMTGICRQYAYVIAGETVQGGARALRTALGKRRPGPLPDTEGAIKRAIDTLAADILTVMEGEPLSKVASRHGITRQAVEHRLRIRTGMGATALRALACDRQAVETPEQLAARLAREGYLPTNTPAGETP
jgi:hypothetical protein